MDSHDTLTEVGKYLTGGAVTMTLSAAARALPVPSSESSTFYGFFYRFAQNLMANFDKAQFSKTAQLRPPKTK